MWTRQHKRRNTGVLIVPAITVVFVSYFAFHAFHGEYGLEARKSLASRTTALKERLEDVREERKAFEHKVALLKDGTLERDMLDEHARRALNMARPDELVIYRSRSTN